MNTFTKAEIRSAILRAADTFERNPSLWLWENSQIPDCGSPGCALGYIGAYLGLSGREVTCATRVLYGEDINARTYRDLDFYCRMDEVGKDNAWHRSAHGAVNALRAYADKYFPAESRALVPMGTWSDVHALIGWRPREVVHGR